jgi:hypothetical protein
MFKTKSDNYKAVLYFGYLDFDIVRLGMARAISGFEFRASDLPELEDLLKQQGCQ